MVSLQLSLCETLLQQQLLKSIGLYAKGYVHKGIAVICVIGQCSKISQCHLCVVVNTICLLRGLLLCLCLLLKQLLQELCIGWFTYHRQCQHCKNKLLHLNIPNSIFFTILFPLWFSVPSCPFSCRN